MMRHKKICKKLITVGIAVLLIAVSCMPMTGMRSQAATFEDNGNTVDIYTDNDYLCIRYNGSWSGYLNERFDLSADGVSLDRLNAIILNNGNNGDGSSFSVKDAWSSEISGASGMVTNTGKKQYYGYEFMTWKIQVPLDTYEAFNLDTLKVTYKGQSTEVAIGTKNTTEEASTENTEEITSATEKDSTEEILTTEDTTETEKNDTTVPGTTEQGVTEAVSEDTTADSTDESTTEISGTESEDSSATITETTSEHNNNASTTGEMTDEATTETTGGIYVGGNIQIDGYYDDWEGRPKTEITYSSNNKQCNHYGQLALDGDTLYGHFKMNELYTSGMQLQIWYLTINGKTFAMQIQPEKNGNIDWSTQAPRSEGIHTNLKAFIGYGNNNECDSKVAYTVYDAEHKDNTPGDEVEFSLSLKRLAELTGIPADEMGTITIQNPNIGGQGVSIAGSSTGPVVGVLIALLLAAGYVAKKRKDKR